MMRLGTFFNGEYFFRDELVSNCKQKIMELSEITWHDPQVSWSCNYEDFGHARGKTCVFALKIPERQLPDMTWLKEVSGDGHLASLLNGTAKFQRQSLVTAALRYHIISKICGVPLREISFHYSPEGKPRLVHPVTICPAHISQSHTDAYALLALSTFPCGVDVEKIRHPENYPNILSKGFPRAWANNVRSMQDGSLEQARRFTAYWTALESYYKIIGTVPMRRFLREQCRDGETVCCGGGNPNCHGYHFDVDSENMACLTLSGGASEIRFFRVSPSFLEGETNAAVQEEL